MAEDGSSDRLWEEYAKEMPAIEAAIEARCVEILQENARNARENLVERLGDEKPTDIELLDLGVEMTEKECHAMYQVAKELDLTNDLAIIDMPGIVGIKDPEAVLTESKIQELYEKGELKLGNIDDIINQIEGRVEKYHMSIETTTELMRETMKFFKDSKIPEEWRDQAAVNNIVFVAKSDLGAVGEAAHPEDLKENLARSRNVYVYLNKNDRFFPPPTEKGEKADKERIETRITIAHEIWHVNEPRVARTFKENTFEWTKAKMVQIEKGGPVTEYYASKGEREFRAEHFAYWAVDPSRLQPEMRSFFDKHFSH